MDSSSFRFKEVLIKQDADIDAADDGDATPLHAKVACLRHAAEVGVEDSSILTKKYT